MSGGAAFAALHGPLAPGELVELRATHAQTGEVYSTWHTSYWSLLDQALRLSHAGWHVWYGINARRGRRRGDRNCTRAWSLASDHDAKLYGGGLAEARCALEEFGVPPSALIFTGGGFQPRWFLEEPLDLTLDAERYRLLGTRLSRAVCGADRRPDTVSNPERVLRVPDTRNWKYEPPRLVTIEWCRPDVRYRADELEAWLDAEAPWTRLAPPPVRPIPYVAASGLIGDFNLRYDPLPLLIAHGARIAHVHGSSTHLTRPGKYRGTSATYNYYPNTLIVFSENWPPFSPRESGRHGYDPFEVFSRLEHGGDRRAAAREAARLGYGDPLQLAGLPVAGVRVSGALAGIVGAMGDGR